MRVNKNWSAEKHFSLNCSLELESAISPSRSDEDHSFKGTFRGNGHTITLAGGEALFGKIAEGGLVDNLKIRGSGMTAGENQGNICNCDAYVTASYGIAVSNSGFITKCSVNGNPSSAGID